MHASRWLSARKRSQHLQAGPIASGLRHGQGRLVCSNGDVFEAVTRRAICNQRMHWCRVRFLCGMQGTFQHDRPHGKGTMWPSRVSRGKEYQEARIRQPNRHRPCALAWPPSPRSQPPHRPTASFTLLLCIMHASTRYAQQRHTHTHTVEAAAHRRSSAAGRAPHAVCATESHAAFRALCMLPGLNGVACCVSCMVLGTRLLASSP